MSSVTVERHLDPSLIPPINTLIYLNLSRERSLCGWAVYSHFSSPHSVIFKHAPTIKHLHVSHSLSPYRINQFAFHFSFLGKTNLSPSFILSFCFLSFPHSVISPFQRKMSGSSSVLSISPSFISVALSYEALERFNVFLLTAS